jgi:hypothetical protein
MTLPLQQLASFLLPAIEIAGRPIPTADNMDDVLSEMKKRANARKSASIPIDQQIAALDRFWDSEEKPSFRDSYLVSWSLALPRRTGGPCIIDDQACLARLLNEIDTWLPEPRNYRRCYKGLISSYFTYDGLRDTVPSDSHRNWLQLRDYIDQRNDRIVDQKSNPDWVETAIDHRALFGTDPYSRYVHALLEGNSRVVNDVCEQLGIIKASWFQRELILAQVRAAVAGNDASFIGRLPRLIDLLGENEILRDRGLILLLDRYASIDGQPLHEGLRDSSVLWWRNPWLPSNETRWGGVTEQAKEMVSTWLKKEFIETFFTKLAEDGLGDTRRMDFWKRYAKQIEHIEFALGTSARYSSDRDFVALRKKMFGLVRELNATGIDNAFIMRIGDLVAVEFSRTGNALYGYDARRNLPFDTAQTLQLRVDDRNSLKNSRSILKLSHQDDVRGWGTWEERFEAELRGEFSISPGERSSATTRRSGGFSAPPSPRFQYQQPTTNAPPQPAKTFTRDALQAFAREHALKIDDKVYAGGNLWIRTGNNNQLVAHTLSRWGFRYKEGKGWWMSAGDA